MALKKWDTNYRLEHSIRKNSTNLSGVPLLPESFRWKDPKKVCFIYFPTGFSKHFVNGKQPKKALSLTTIRYKKDVEDSEEGGRGGGVTSL